jgi:phosphatidylglycerophosphate synthase
MHGGDLLTFGRLAVTLPFLYAFAAGLGGSTPAGVLAGLMFAFAAASDYFDGKLARRAGMANERGRVWDSAADILFIEGALVTATVLGRVPWWVPASIAASFGWYVLDSWFLTRARPQRTLIGSRLGHLGGVCNYVLVGVLTYNDALGLRLLGDAFLRGLYLLVPIYSVAAIGARLIGRVQP